MMVLVLTAAPQRLRGDLTKWLLEISPGVYVGNPSARIREQLWKRVEELVETGRAILVHSSVGEQRLAFKVHNHQWEVVDLDGLQLIKRPSLESHDHKANSTWSNARMAERGKRPAWRKQFE